MGALHEGHTSLVRLAAAHADAVAVSIFVNPLQFDRPDDLESYPRDLDADEAALAGLGADAPAFVFAPAATEIYPRELLTGVHVRGLTQHLCGVSRPGHFDGVATVVTKLLNLVQPDVAVFGRKDRQQLEVIRRLVADLDLPVRIVDAPTVRDPDGVAVSSRNALLTPEQRQLAWMFPRALVATVHEARAARERGESVSAEELREAALTSLVSRRAVGLSMEYVEVVDPATLARPPAGESPQTLLVALAGFVGPVRLIDNVEVGDLDDEQRLLDGFDPGEEG